MEEPSKLLPPQHLTKNPKLLDMPITKEDQKKETKVKKKIGGIEFEIEQLRKAVPTDYDWRSTDEQEVARRKMRALEEKPVVVPREPEWGVFGSYEIRSSSGHFYKVESVDPAAQRYECNCADYRKNGLGTCKHIEAVKLYQQAKHKKQFQELSREKSPRVEIVLVDDCLKVEGDRSRERELKKLCDEDGFLSEESFDGLFALSRDEKKIRISWEVSERMRLRGVREERLLARREYEEMCRTGQCPTQETLHPLLPYQREGMLHLAFNERALLADEMGLGKTIQAIAACSLVHRLGKAQRVLVVAPASLKAEWEEQITRFTALEKQVVYGGKHQRIACYDREKAPFFTIVNYEQVLTDFPEINAHLQPEIVVLDEAQRIKNWGAKTAQAVKRLQSRYAFVLTGTPIENKIDEIYSIMDFVEPGMLGALFRFNREYYQLDEKGRPQGYCNLDKLRKKIAPYLLRRRKADVEKELPSRVDRNVFVKMSAAQSSEYQEHSAEVMKLWMMAKKRALSQREREKLMRELAMMRMICDTLHIMDRDVWDSPKIDELSEIMDEVLEEKGVKMIVFSEWAGMLELVRELCRGKGLGYAWHTGSVPQKKRRAEILAFKNDPECRVFLSTDSGGVGLNLQNASVVVNCDLPWNPAKLEQRIARAWRKNQVRSVTVLNFISEGTIEHRMLETLASKKSLAEGVLDSFSKVTEMPLRAGGPTLFQRLGQMLAQPLPAEQKGCQVQTNKPADIALSTVQSVASSLGDDLVKAEQHFIHGSEKSLMVFVVRSASGVERRGAIESVCKKMLGNSALEECIEPHPVVMDERTFEQFEQLKNCGLISINTRARRGLFPLASEAEQGKKLDQESVTEIKRLSEEGKQAIRIMRLLVNGGFSSETKPYAQKAARSVADIYAVRNQLPKIQQDQDVWLSPWKRVWGDETDEIKNKIEKGELDEGLMARFERGLSE